MEIRTLPEPRNTTERAAEGESARYSMAAIKTKQVHDRPFTHELPLRYARRALPMASLSGSADCENRLNRGSKEMLYYPVFSNSCSDLAAVSEPRLSLTFD
jgi:hypothetical protein